MSHEIGGPGSVPSDALRRPLLGPPIPHRKVSVSSPSLDAAPVDGDGTFHAVDALGYEVALRRPRPSEALCGPCRGAVLADAIRRAGHHAIPATELPALDEVLDEVPDEVLEALNPRSGRAGHDCLGRLPAPVWVLSHPDCAGARAHLTPDETGRSCRSPVQPGQGCRAGVTSLHEALRHLPVPDREVAVNAHLRLLEQVAAHLAVTDTLLGTPLDGESPTMAGPDLTLACVACLADPDAHAEDLHDEVTTRTLELIPVLATHRVQLTLQTATEPGSPARGAAQDGTGLPHADAADAAAGEPG